MRKGIFYHDLINCKEFYTDTDKMMCFCRENGIEAIQFDRTQLTEDCISQILPSMNKYGIKFAGIFIMCRLCADDISVFSSAVNKCMETVDLSVKLGCKRVLVVACEPCDIEDKSLAALRFVNGLNKVCDYAAKFGISIAVENFSDPVLPFSLPEDIIFLKENVKNLSYVFDTGNFLLCDVDAMAAYGMLEKYVDEIHVKDFYFTDNAEFYDKKGRGVSAISFGNGQTGMKDVLKKALKNKKDILYIIEHNTENISCDDIKYSCQFLRFCL